MARTPSDEPFFFAAADLYRAAPWKTLFDRDALLIETDEPILDGWAIVFTGRDSDRYGMLAFDDLATVEEFFEVIDGDDDERAVPPFVALRFEGRKGMSAEKLGVLRELDVPLGGANAVPSAWCFAAREKVPAGREDVERLTLAAGAAAAFWRTHGAAIRAEVARDHEPLERRHTHTTESGVAVTVRGPIALDEELPPPRHFELSVAPQLVRPSAPAPSHPRNAPCPCGSGKKYKLCHESADDSARTPTPQELAYRRSLLDAKLADHGKRRLGHALWDEPGALFADCPDDDGLIAQLLIPIALHDWPHDGLEGDTLSADYLSHQPLDDLERTTLVAHARTCPSLWQVLSTTPGESVTLRDLFTLEERTCTERAASQTLRRWEVLLARVVEFPESTQLYMYPRALPPRTGEPLAESIRKQLRLKKGKAGKRDKVFTFETGVQIVTGFCEVLREMFEASTPKLRTTTGEPFLVTTDHFDLSGDIELTARKLVAGGFERDKEDPRRLVRLEPATPGVLGDTILIAQLKLSRGRLSVETSSLARADRMRSLIESALDGEIRHRLREHSDPMSGLAQRGVPSRLPSLEEIPAELRETLAARFEAHWSGWCDDPLPALDGKTPRQAAASKKLRARLLGLLREFESAATGDVFEPDVAALRARLGLRSDER
jgi:hypothetical protein